MTNDRSMEGAFNLSHQGLFYFRKKPRHGASTGRMSTGDSDGLTADRPAVDACTANIVVLYAERVTRALVQKNKQVNRRYRDVVRVCSLGKSLRRQPFRTSHVCIVRETKLGPDQNDLLRVGELAAELGRSTITPRLCRSCSASLTRTLPASPTTTWSRISSR